MQYQLKQKMKYLKTKIFYKIFLTFWLVFNANLSFAAGTLVVRDIETEEFLREISAPLIEQELVASGSVDRAFQSGIKNGEKPIQTFRPTFSLTSRGIKAVPVNQLPQFKENPFPRVNSGALFSKPKKQKPQNIELFLINDDALNAFVTNGKKVFVFSGLITAYDNSNLLRGVLAHELSHIFAAHLTRSAINADIARKDAAVGGGFMTLLTLASGGSGMAAGLTSLFSATTIANSTMLEFSREYEKEADSKALRNLMMLGYSAHGLLDLMNDFKSKMAGGEIPQIYRYFSTHPLPDERYAIILRSASNEDQTTLRIDLAVEDKFQRVKAKILGINGFLQNYTPISTRYSGLPSQLSSKLNFYSRYRELFYYFGKFDYKETINIGLDLLRFAPNDVYIGEVLGQSYCALSDMSSADYYFGIVRSKIRNNLIIEYEYGECLTRFGKEDSDIQRGIGILYASHLLNLDEKEISDLIIKACQKIENRGVRGLSELMSAKESAKILAGETKAIETLEKVIYDKDFENFEYKNQVLAYYNELKN